MKRIKQLPCNFLFLHFLRRVQDNIRAVFNWIFYGVLRKRANPKGVAFYSPGSRSHPGYRNFHPSTLKGVHRRSMQPLQGWDLSLANTQGSSFLATLGYRIYPLWGTHLKIFVLHPFAPFRG